MSELQKGIILTLEGPNDRNGQPTRARVQSTSADGTSTMPITIPWYIRGTMGDLQKGTEVAYAKFDDETGILISRMDGEWSGSMHEQNIHISGNVVVTGDVDISGSTNAADITCSSLAGGTVRSGDVILATHVHGGVESGNHSTNLPE